MRLNAKNIKDYLNFWLMNGERNVGAVNQVSRIYLVAEQEMLRCCFELGISGERSSRGYLFVDLEW